jgi:hypothetical protein
VIAMAAPWAAASNGSKGIAPAPTHPSHPARRVTGIKLV